MLNDDAMNENEIIILVFIALLILFAYFLIRSIIKRKRKNEIILKEMEQPLLENQPTEIKAVVVSKDVEIQQKGIKIPEHRMVFKVCLSTDDGKIKEYEVSNQDYEELVVNDYIAGVIENGWFYILK